MPSLDTLNEIAEKINVPLWQLFTEPQKYEFSAIIDYKGELKKVTSIEELEKIVQEIKENK